MKKIILPMMLIMSFSLCSCSLTTAQYLRSNEGEKLISSYMTEVSSYEAHGNTVEVTYDYSDYSAEDLKRMFGDDSKERRGIEQANSDSMFELKQKLDEESGHKTTVTWKMVIEGQTFCDGTI